MAPPKGKGKDLSRMTAPPLASAAPAPVSSLVALSQQSTSGSGGATATASRVPSPRSGNKPKGKDFSRMTGPPSSAVQQQPPATVAVSQPPPAVSSQPPPGTTSFEHLENIRRQNAARVAAGMPPIANPMVGVVARPTPSSVSVDKAKPLVPVNRRVSNHQPLPSQVALASTSYAPPQPQRQQLVVNALVPNTPTQFRQQQQTSVSTHAPKQAPKTVQQTQQQQTQQQQTQQQQTQQQPLVVKSNVSTNAIIHPITKEVQQPTQRPSWSDARLSTMEGSSSSKAKTSSISKKSQDGYGKPTLAPILGEKLVALCHSIDPSYTLDSEVQERLVEMADSFVEKVTRDATKLAKHRGSNCLDVVDVALALKKGYNMAVPGLGPPSVGAGAGGKGGQGMGGWLFADKVNPGRDEQPKKKRRASGTAAATAAAM